MAKFSGKIGYIVTAETDPGVWEETAIEKQYYGDLVKNTSRYTASDSVNDNITISNSISIVADKYACENYMHIRYVIFMNAKWKVSNAELSYPRITLTLGGLYHANEQ